MTLILGHLPSDVEEQDIRVLFKSLAKINKLEFLADNNQVSRQCDYECMVTLEISNPVLGTAIVNRLNHYCWKNCMINAHMLIF